MIGNAIDQSMYMVTLGHFGTTSFIWELYRFCNSCALISYSFLLITTSVGEERINMAGRLPACVIDPGTG